MGEMLQKMESMSAALKLQMESVKEELAAVPETKEEAVKSEVAKREPKRVEEKRVPRRRSPRADEVRQNARTGDGSRRDCPCARHFAWRS